MVCKECKIVVSDEIIQSEGWICPQCGKYFSINARTRIRMLADANTFKEWDTQVKEEKTSLYLNKIGEAIVTGEMKIAGIPLAIGVMDNSYMLASMGFAVGEKVTRLFERARKRGLPVVIFCCSGGARIQEGIISLMQMEKTAASVKRHSKAGLLYVSILTNPTMGGVAASFATSADIVLAEKGAGIGFAGFRVIEQNIGEKLPIGYQTAEFQLSHGYVDAVISRIEIREYLIELLRFHQKRQRIHISEKKLSAQNIMNDRIKNMDIWDIVRDARSVKRPTSLEYIAGIFDFFLELHGDRVLNDDHAIVGGLALINGKAVTVIGNQKGKSNIQEAKYRNWGMASPGGYRKALRLARQAEKFGRPVIFFVDTIGAACGIEAEKHGQICSISNMLTEMSDLKVPVLSIIHGEAGSGGALALGVANEVWILEKATYSVLTPEGFASILWKDRNKAIEASKIMEMTSLDLFREKVVDKVLEEPDEWDEISMEEFCSYLKEEIALFIKKNQNVSGRRLAKRRYRRFRSF